jgi:hypothetical protein
MASYLKLTDSYERYKSPGKITKALPSKRKHNTIIFIQFILLMLIWVLSDVILFLCTHKQGHTRNGCAEHA